MHATKFECEEEAVVFRLSRPADTERHPFISVYSARELRDGDMAKREQALEDRETFVAARELALAKRECAVKKIPNVPPGSAPSGFQEWSQRRWVERTHTHAHADTPTHAHTHARTFMHATKFECEEEAKVFRPRQ